MGEKTERLVDHVRAAWNQHDALCFASLFSDDALLRIIATGDVMHGREQIQQFAEAFLRAFPDLRIDRRSTRLQRGSLRHRMDAHGHPRGGVHGHPADPSLGRTARLLNFCCSFRSELRSHGSPAPCVMTKTGAHLTPRSTQLPSPSFNLRRNQLSYGAAGAGLSSALSSLLSSARSRIPGPPEPYG